MKLFISAGEPSGDLHGGHVVTQLRKLDPELQVLGFGGPQLTQAGVRVLFDLPSLALMGFVRILKHIPQLQRVLAQAKAALDQERPDVVLLIDYPGFHWHLAQAAKERGIPVYYYCPPQLWGWGAWRIKKLKRLVDHVLCCLPFEEAWYKSQGVPCTLVGHPFFDDLTERQLDQEFIAALKQSNRPLVALLPGSRNHEVTDNTQLLLNAARKVRQVFPETRFVAACLKDPHREQLLRAAEHGGVELEAHAGRTPEIISACDCAISVSGSVSLELMYHEKPSVMIYRTSWLGYIMQAMFRRVKYFTLVNLLNAKELHPQDLRLYQPDQPESVDVLYPEYLCLGDRSSEIAAHVIDWIQHENGRNQVIQGLQALNRQVAIPGSTQRVAELLAARFVLPVVQPSLSNEETLTIPTKRCA